MTLQQKVETDLHTAWVRTFWVSVVSGPLTERVDKNMAVMNIMMSLTLVILLNHSQVCRTQAQRTSCTFALHDFRLVSL